jgi:hypothetical protein
MTRELHADVTAISGLIVLGLIGVVAINHGDGETVAAAAVGAIGGFMARGARTTTESTGPTSTTTEPSP